jgi:hypothetical protein
MYITPQGNDERDYRGEPAALKDEIDPFEAFGDIDPGNDNAAPAMLDAEPESAPSSEVAPFRVRTGFSWVAFAGGLAALGWLGAAIGGAISYFGVDGMMVMSPLMQAGAIAFAIGPALLFWLGAAAAGEALKARRVAMQLAALAHDTRAPFDATRIGATQLSGAVRREIEQLNEAIATAIDRMADLEAAAQRNTALFEDAVSASSESNEAMTETLARERAALLELNGEIKGKTETMANAIGRQVRLLREASTLVKTEVVAAEGVFETQLARFDAATFAMGERVADFETVANDATASASSLDGVMARLLEGLSEATRLSETARRSTEQAVTAANDTAGALRETTRAAVFEAKRAAQLIRAETASMQQAANDTLAKLQQSATSARAASRESQAASVERRLGAFATAAGAKRSVREERVAVRTDAQPQARGTPVREAQAPQGGRVFSNWANFMPPQQSQPAKPVLNYVDREIDRDPDALLQSDALDLLADAGVDLHDALHANDLDRIARKAREGATARRRAVVDATPGAVSRLARHLKRDVTATNIAKSFRARPDLTESDDAQEAGDLVRAFLLIDAALT